MNLLELALDALKDFDYDKRMAAIETLRKALEQEPVAWEHLKAYGYAPGGYMMICRGCKNEVINVDKRALRCRACAEAEFTRNKE